MIPRVKGLQATLDNVRDSLDGVVDITVGYSDHTKSGHARPSINDLFFGGLRAWPVHIHVRVIPIADVPKTGEEISTWAMETFKFKDELLRGFKEKGHFPGEECEYRMATPFGMLLNHTAFFGVAGAVLAGFLSLGWTAIAA
jgi:hypothetical protein